MGTVKRVVFCTYPSIYSSIVLSILLRCPSIEVVAIISSTRNLKVNENKLTADIERIKVSGMQYAFYLLAITQLYKALPFIFKQRSFESLCKKAQIDVISTSNINDPKIQKKVENIKPDVLFCAHFNQLIHPSTYNLAQEAAVNLHPSLLPDLKGVDPAFYALTDKYSDTGVTIHHLAKDFDTGQIIQQKAQEIKADDTLLSLNKTLFKLGAELFVDSLSQEQREPLSHKSTDRYDSWPSKKDVAKFKQHRHFLFSKLSFRNLFG